MRALADGFQRELPARRRRRVVPFLRGLVRGLDPIRLSAALLVVVTLTAVHMYLGPLRHTRPGFTLLALVSALILIRPGSVRWANLREAWPAKAVAALLGLAIASAVFGLSMGGSLRFLFDLYWKVLFFFGVLTISIRSVRDLAVIIWSFVLSVGILVILSLTVAEVNQTSTGLNRIDGQGMFDGNDLGMVVLMGLPLALLMLFHSGRTGRWLSALVLLGIPVTVALTGSRGAMVGVAVMALPLFFALGRFSLVKRLGGVLVLAVALLLAAPSGYWSQMGTTFSPGSDYNYASDYGRVALAKRGMGYMLQRPVFGVGVANFGRAEGTISPIIADRAMDGLAIMWVAPHNTYVQVGAELGVPGLLAWLAMLWAGSWGLLRQRRRIPRAWEHQSAERRLLRDACLFIPISFVSFAATSFFLTHAYTPPIYILLAITAGVLVLVRRELRRDAALAHAPTVSARFM